MPRLFETGTIVMTDDRRAFAVLCPISTVRVAAGRRIQAARVGTGQNIVRIHRVTAPAHRLAFFGESRRLGHIDRIRMQVLDALGHHVPLGILPWPFADALARIHPSVAARCRGAQVSLPTGLGSSRGLGQRHAMRVGTLEAAEVAAVALTNAGDEESHRRLLRMHRHGQTDGSQCGTSQHLNCEFRRHPILP